MKPAVVLLSGGLDSTTTLAWAKAEGYECYALSVDYGQRHRVELARAAAVATAFGAVEHRTVTLDLRAIGGSALTADVAVPKDRTDEAIGHGVPMTYVPARNTILLGVALGYAETVGAFDLFIGANVLDYSGYPDCRPEFIEAFQSMARLGTKRTAFRVHDPLVRLSKSQIITLGTSLGVDYGMTHSCYDPDPIGLACGRCDSCILRKRGFAEAGVAERIIFDLGLTRSIGYYTGAVFEVYDPALGAPIGGGGRYDDLLSRFGRALPAVGFALGIDRLHIALAGEERGTGALLAQPAGAGRTPA